MVERRTHTVDLKRPVGDLIPELLHDSVDLTTFEPTYPERFSRLIAALRAEARGITHHRGWWTLDEDQEQGSQIVSSDAWEVVFKDGQSGLLEWNAGEIRESGESLRIRATGRVREIAKSIDPEADLDSPVAEESTILVEIDHLEH